MLRWILLFIGIFLINLDLLDCKSYPAPSQDWNQMAKDELKSALNIKQINTRAKNVILFLGDGMGMSTVTASRIYKGQLEGHSGEEGALSFEKFPHVGLSKTYDVDAQVSDSASTATAYLSGEKTKYYTLGCNENVVFEDCSSVKGNELESILMLSQKEGKSTGIVTTTRITHATPAACYASIANRDWEGNTPCPDKVEDIALQLITQSKKINVILGGGRTNFQHSNQNDPEYPDISGSRKDNRDLISEWLEIQGENSHYVWNQTSFDSLDTDKVENLLGMFEPQHMHYEHQRSEDSAGEPSLTEMMEKSLKILSKNEIGYFLLIEGGRIDHAHHDQQAKRALDEAVEFSKAIEKALTLTEKDETLIIVTADHSHTFTLGGAAGRGNPILETQNNERWASTDNMPYQTVGYHNGNKVRRLNISEDILDDWKYQSAGLVPTESESHGGEDVPIYALGPFAHLIHGVHEQHYIAHVMQYASCVGSYNKEPHCKEVSSANTLTSSRNCLFITICLFIIALTR